MSIVTFRFFSYFLDLHVFCGYLGLIGQVSQLPAYRLVPGIHESPVYPILIHKLLVCAALNDAASVYDEDLVCVSHGLEPVGDHEDGLFPGEVPHRQIPQVTILLCAHSP